MANSEVKMTLDMRANPDISPAQFIDPITMVAIARQSHETGPVKTEGFVRQESARLALSIAFGEEPLTQQEMDFIMNRLAEGDA